MGGNALRNLSTHALNQLFFQESSDPFLMLFTLSHSSFGDIYLVNNPENIISRGTTFEAFPVSVTLPVDDGESLREVVLTLDNASRE